ncbi:MAG: hypothetical protein ACR2P0_18125 [Acidimicrobiales bacterium]
MPGIEQHGVLDHGRQFGRALQRRVRDRCVGDPQYGLGLFECPNRGGVDRGFDEESRHACVGVASDGTDGGIDGLEIRTVHLDAQPGSRWESAGVGCIFDERVRLVVPDPIAEPVSDLGCVGLRLGLGGGGCGDGRDDREHREHPCTKTFPHSRSE